MPKIKSKLAPSPNSDNNKYRKLCRVYIRPELKCEPREKTECVFLTLTILRMEMDCNF